MKKIACSLLLLFFCLSLSYSYAQAKKEIVFYNWKDYTDKTILEDFEKKFGIKVILKEFETEDMMLSKFQSEPENYDVVIVSGVSVHMLKEYRLVAELDLTQIPNRKFIKKQFKTPPYDPEGKYSLPHLWGTVGLVINTNFVPADIDSWAVLWDKKYKGKIALLDEYREAMASVLKYSNFSLNTADPQELKIVEENAKLLWGNDVQFGETFGNLEKVMSGELWIAQVYNGDVVYKAKDRKDIKYLLPKEGFSIWVDNFVISANTRNKKEAHQLINWFLEPRNAARTANMFSYATAIEAEAFIYKENLNNPIIYPSEDLLRKGEFYIDLGKTEDEYVKIFNLLKQEKE